MRPDIEMLAEIVEPVKQPIRKHPAPWLPCTLCDKSFTDKEARRHHWRDVHSRGGKHGN